MDILAFTRYLSNNSLTWFCEDFKKKQKVPNSKQKQQKQKLSHSSIDDYYGIVVVKKKKTFSYLLVVVLVYKKILIMEPLKMPTEVLFTEMIFITKTKQQIVHFKLL